METIPPGVTPASYDSQLIDCERVIGGGGGSRTRVRNRSAWAVYVCSPFGCSRRPPPEGADERPASPCVFAIGPRAGRRAIPLCDAHPVPRGRRVRWTGCLSSQR